MQINSEVTAYSFDRLIVCETAEIAQFLIANNFHFEHNCAVLSIDGYPQNIWFFKFSTVTNTAFFLFLLGIGLGIFLIYFGMRQLSVQHKIPQPFKFKQSEITQWLRRWEEINGEVTNVLPPSREMSEPIQINSEVTAYSFDRVIVCDTAEIAQFLIANNFHF
ncbi:hypothetical protein [Okeania sp. SIO1I7]|uniref:hypothetical protein n=1 Tax=Okeania sp. SIO1I7 TaxID=2607772 RepID=UPI0013F92271|nr:hypothetical protein [Okeania sp. SIO1I7]NET29771.1 hypothetical protein [Okeania sp. SIO1I7]